jgi:UDP-glucose 4-epimerase
VRVLVTGATTPLGAALAAALLDDDAVEHVLALGAEPHAAGRLPDDRRLTYLAVDLTRARAVHDVVHGPARQLGITAVVHGPLHRSARDQGRRVHALNVESTRQLLLACEGHPTIRRFVVRSSAEVYQVRPSEPNLVDEDQPLDFDPGAPQWIRDRVEADQIACSRAGLSSLSIAVLRCSEVLAPEVGSQLWDYLASRVCLRPLGYDPMINILSVADAVVALRCALAGDQAQGVFNVPGADTLPLSAVIRRRGRIDLPLPGPLLAPLYRLRTWTVGFEFRYDLNLRRFHFGGVLDGQRAAARLGYRPRHPALRPARPEGAAPRKPSEPPAPSLPASWHGP